MEENKENLEEQPQSVETSAKTEENENGSSAVETAENLSVSDEQSEAERGVPVGKFKSVDDLYQAYNNLEAEFTRKCQRLSALEKDKTTETENELLEEKFKLFLSQNQDAVVYSDELKNRVMQDESLKKEKSPFDKAWAGLLYEKLSGPNKAKEPLVQKLILKDNELKNLVIENYMKQLTTNKTPIVMSSNSGERVTKVVTQKPDSFEQAKKVVLDLLS